MRRFVSFFARLRLFALVPVLFWCGSEPLPAAWTTLAGLAQNSGSADGIASGARFYHPTGVAVDSNGNVIVADYGNNVIRKITSDGRVSTLAGLAGYFANWDGIGSSARFTGPCGVALDGGGNVFVADSLNCTIRRVAPDGTVTTFAGVPGVEGSGDGSVLTARFSLPSAVAVDAVGNVYVADTGNHVIRKISPSLSVSTVAGLAGWAGASNGSGSAARFSSPSAIAVDGAGNLYVADTGNHTIRFVTSDGRVSTIAGLAGMYGVDDGQGTAARFYSPAGVAVDSGGVVYVSDTGSQTIRKISASGLVTTIGGSPGVPGIFDGEGSAAWFYAPTGIAVDSAGRVYVADRANHTIRKFEQRPLLAAGPSSLAVNVGSRATFRVSAFGSGPLSYQWRKDGVSIGGATNATFILPAALMADSGNYDVLVSNPSGTTLSPSARLIVFNAKPIAFSQQPLDVTFLRGVSSSVRIAVDSAGSDTSRTIFQVFASGVAEETPVAGFSGIVPVSGVLDLPLRNLPTTGDYFVRVTRDYEDGTYVSTDSMPFHANVKNWDSAAGSYETLLLDSSHAVGEPGAVDDGAQFRGLLAFTISKTGYVSGRLQYVEAADVGTPSIGSVRRYFPVTRSFSASFGAAVDKPLWLTCSPKMSGGPQSTREELSLEIDFQQQPPAVKAKLIDRFSSGAPGGVLAGSQDGVRSLGSVPVALGGVVGRYVLCANPGLPLKASYVLVQTLPSGRVLWSTRKPGYSGTGSALLTMLGSSQMEARLFEARLTSTPSSLSATALLGKLRFVRGADSTWSAGFVSQTGIAGFEEQASLVSKSVTLGDWGRVSRVDFSGGGGCRWSGVIGSGLSTFFPPAHSLRMSLQDAVSGAAYAWNVTVSSSGAVRTSPVVLNSVTPPALNLRIDKIRGEWSGSYVPQGGIRRTLYGGAVTPTAVSPEQARGWSESGAASQVSASEWTLLPIP